MFQIIVKAEVRNMLNEIYHWYEEQVPGLGERFLDEMDIGLIKL